jgi:hypothetical protein
LREFAGIFGKLAAESPGKASESFGERERAGFVPRKGERGLGRSLSKKANKSLERSRRGSKKARKSLEEGSEEPRRRRKNIKRPQKSLEDMVQARKIKESKKA